MDRKNKRPLCAATPAAYRRPPERPAASRSTAQRDFGWYLDRRLRMGEGSASGVPWGDGLGKDGLESWRGTVQFSRYNCQLVDIRRFAAHVLLCSAALQSVLSDAMRAKSTPLALPPQAQTLTRGKPLSTRHVTQGVPASVERGGRYVQGHANSLFWCFSGRGQGGIMRYTTSKIRRH